MLTMRKSIGRWLSKKWNDRYNDDSFERITKVIVLKEHFQSWQNFSLPSWALFYKILQEISSHFFNFNLLLRPCCTLYAQVSLNKLDSKRFEALYLNVHFFANFFNKQLFLCFWLHFKRRSDKAKIKTVLCF